MRAIGVDPVHDTHGTFRALCDAMSRPGTVERVPIAPADHAVVATLVDHEVPFHSTDEELTDALAGEGRLERAAPAAAAVVHAPRGAARSGVDWDVRELTRGSLREPSEGATVVYRTDGLSVAPGRTAGVSDVDGDDAADADSLTTLAVSGPGVDGERTVGVGLPAAELDALATAQATYPRGVDAVFTHCDAVAALPRACTVDVVDGRDDGARGEDGEAERSAGARGDGEVS